MIFNELHFWIADVRRKTLNIHKNFKKETDQIDGYYDWQQWTFLMWFVKWISILFPVSQYASLFPVSQYTSLLLFPVSLFPVSYLLLFPVSQYESLLSESQYPFKFFVALPTLSVLNCLSPVNLNTLLKFLSPVNLNTLPPSCVYFKFFVSLSTMSVDDWWLWCPSMIGVWMSDSSNWWMCELMNVFIRSDVSTKSCDWHVPIKILIHIYTL